MQNILFYIHRFRLEISLIYFKIKKNYSFKIKNRIFDVNPIHYKFWYKVKKNSWEKNNLLIFEKFINKDDEYLDIGAWIGPTLFQASLFTTNISCVEPDPINFYYLKDNLKRSNLSKVISYHFPIIEEDRLVEFISSDKKGSSTAREIEKNEENHKYVLNGITWQKFILGISNKKFDFIKIDIEGAEYKLILDIRDYVFKFKPTIYCSFHPFFNKKLHEEKISEILEILSIYKFCYNENLIKIDINNYIFNFDGRKENSLIFSDKNIKNNDRKSVGQL